MQEISYLLATHLLITLVYALLEIIHWRMEALEAIEKIARIKEQFNAMCDPLYYNSLFGHFAPTREELERESSTITSTELQYVLPDGFKEVR